MGIADSLDHSLSTKTSQLINQVEANSVNSWPQMKSLDATSMQSSQVADPMEVQRVMQTFLLGTATISSRRDIRLLSGGIRSIMNTPGTWATRLKIVFQSPEVSSSAWFQLVCTYWDSDLCNAHGNENWKEVGRLLKSQLLPWLKLNCRTSWQKEISNYPDLFESEVPIAFCINHSDLHKDGLEHLFKQIGAGSNSWLYASLILGEIKAITNESDTIFISKIPVALTRIEECIPKFPTIGNRALAMVADRYQNGQGFGIHDQLRNDTIKAWGNPRFSTSDVAWSQVSPQTRQMVKEWLSEWDLEQFFSLLSTDPNTDIARLNYWKPYASQMTATHIVLGTRAILNGSDDFIVLRKHLQNEKRFSELIGSTTNNNAFIFEMNGYQFIEFGATGNALYIYEKNNAPIDFSHAISSKLHISKLKEKSKNWMHLSHSGNWIASFNVALQNAGIINTASKNTVSKMNNSTININSLKLQFGAHKIEDNRHLGGYLRILTSTIDSKFDKNLREMGFNYTPGKGYWRH